jgi:hypothetical protein
VFHDHSNLPLQGGRRWLSASCDPLCPVYSRAGPQKIKFFRSVSSAVVI